jgi:hypothetical protein
LTSSILEARLETSLINDFVTVGANAICVKLVMIWVTMGLVIDLERILRKPDQKVGVTSALIE